MTKKLVIACLMLCMLPVVSLAQNQKEKPVLKVSADGFPTGHSTPEGAACDLARAFIKHNPALFEQTCIAPFGGGENRKTYESFRKFIVAQMKQEAKRAKPSPNGPKSIIRVYAARSLSKDGPASYGYATFGFKDIKFVDIAVTLQNGKQAMNRTMVIQDSTGKWYVHPLPSVSPLLSDGLNQESPSSKTIADAYTLRKD